MKEIKYYGREREGGAMKKFVFENIPKTTIKAYENAARKQAIELTLKRLTTEFKKDFSEGEEEAAFNKVFKSLEKKYGIMLCPWVWLRREKGKENAWGFDVLADKDEEE